MDLADREAMKQRAGGLIDGLESAGVTGVITTFVDNSGIVRMKSTPVQQLPHAAAWGLGFPFVFDRARFDDVIIPSGAGDEPIGDVRLMPDIDRLVPLAAQPGWAWAPADRYRQDSTPHPQDSRLLLQRVVRGLLELGISVRCAFEIEWVLSPAASDEFAIGVSGPAYGLSRFMAASDYCRDLLAALRAQGVTVEQLHPEYAASQFEISVAAESPVGAADTTVLVRSTIRAVGLAHGYRTSFSPKVDVSGVGNGGHCHLSIWRGGVNLMSGGDGPAGLTADGEAFTAGVLAHVDALVAIGCPSVVSYLRLTPANWSGDYACWGVENREAAVRIIPGPPESSARAANVEVKCFDQFANPYLLLAGVLTAAKAGLAEGARLPAPVTVDPSSLSDESRSAAGIRRLPTSLRDSLAAFLADDVLTQAFGADLVRSLSAIRESEIELFKDANPEAIAAANLWRF